MPSSPGWKTRIEAARSNRDRYLTTWQTNVAFRVMRPFGGETDQDRIALPEDWARTKSKIAALNFELPKIVATDVVPGQAAGSIITQAVNWTLRTANAHYMIDECLSDVVNGAGLMASKIWIDKRVEDVPAPPEPQIPLPLEMTPPADAGAGDVLPEEPLPSAGLPEAPPTEVLESTAAGASAPDAGVPLGVPAQRVAYQAIRWDRISPADLLWPEEFRSSNWNDAGWLGHDAWRPVEEVRRQYKLGEDWKPGTRKRQRLSGDLLDEKSSDDLCCVTEIWYYGSRYRAEVVHPHEIWVCVYVDGQDEPVLEERAQEQEWVEPASPDGVGHWRGLTKLPIRVETLVYVSDLAVPPSDSEVGRAQVRELMKSRLQMFRQRDHSIPIRWYDVNRLDEVVANGLRAGTWQDMIPVNGPGDRVIGEVARANYPRENFQFQTVIGGDLDRAWGQSNNQLAVTNETDRSATEVSEVAEAYDTDLAKQKSRVNRYVTEGAELVFSLMQMFYLAPDYVEIIGEEGVKALAEVAAKDLDGEFTFDFVADSSDRLSAQKRQENILKLANLTVNSPSTNRREIESELFESFGLDPKRFVLPPEPPKTEAPNVSYRFNGADLINPIALALMQKANPLSPEEIAAAAKIIADAMMLQGAIMTSNPVMGTAQPGMGMVQPGMGMPGAPAGVMDPTQPVGLAPSVQPSQNMDQAVTPPTPMEPVTKRLQDGQEVAA